MEMVTSFQAGCGESEVVPNLTLEEGMVPISSAFFFEEVTHT